MLCEPGPDADQLQHILTAAARVPDHKKLVPWRFIVFVGHARRTFGAQLAAILQAEACDAPSQMRLDTERGRLERAPCVVCVVASHKPVASVPLIEQTLSCGAAAFNLCLAANALGFATAWITEWYSYSPGVARCLDLDAQEQVAGFVYIGTQSQAQADRDRPDLDQIVSFWGEDAASSDPVSST